MSKTEIDETLSKNKFYDKSKEVPSCQIFRILLHSIPPILLSIVVFFFCYPFVFIISGSFMADSEIAHHLAGIIPGQDGLAQFPPVPLYPTLESFIELLIDTPGFYPLFWNSVIITLSVLPGQVIISIPAAWTFAHYDFSGKTAIFFLYIAVMVMPFQVTMLPQYLVVDSLHLLDTLLSVIIPGIFSVFPVFILTHFFKNIPKNLLDAARLDGASELGILLRVGIPLTKPGIFAALFLGFIEYWNIIEQPLIFLSDQTAWPLSLFLPSASLDQSSLVFVATLITCIPAVFAFLWGRQYLEQGIAALTKT